MATKTHSAATALPKPVQPTFITPYGGADLDINRATFAVLLDDLLQDLSDIRQVTSCPKVHARLDSCLQSLAATAGIVTIADLRTFPDYPGDDTLFGGHDGDGFGDMRWLAAVVQQAWVQ